MERVIVVYTLKISGPAGYDLFLSIYDLHSLERIVYFIAYFLLFVSGEQCVRTVHSFRVNRPRLHTRLRA